MAIRAHRLTALGFVICSIFGATVDAQSKRALNPQIKLSAGTIDRLGAPANDAAVANSAHAVIQLSRPLSIRERRLIEATGAVLDAYVPDEAYLVDLSAADRASLKRLPFITAMDVWQPDWKLSPKLNQKRRYVTETRKQLARAGKERLVIHAHKHINTEALHRELQALDVDVIDQAHAYHGHQILIEVANDVIDSLTDIDAVRFIDLAPEAYPRNSSTNWIAQSNIPDATPIWDRGLHGENQLVGLIDWDMDELHCSFRDTAAFGDEHRKIQAYFGFDQSLLFGYHGTHTASVLAGDPLEATAAIDLVGIADASRLIFQDQAAIITPTNLAERLLIAQAEGANIHSNSWGSNFDNSYNAWAADIDAFSFENEDNLVIFAVINGNATTPLLSPENAKNCLAVGASGDAGEVGNPGSGATGPTPDGRQKPEIWAPGCSSQAANDGTACDVIERSCATSWAAPAVAGLTALTRQYFTEGYYPNGTPTATDGFTPTGALLKAMLINSAVDMDGIEGYFGAREGYGRVLLNDALFFDGDARGLLVHDIRHADGLQTGNEADFEFIVQDDAQPLKVTLCYHDAPALVGTEFAPVNNLDLSVISPSGIVYRGNDYSGLETQANGTADPLNNSEQISRLNPEIGSWQIKVSGTAVNDGPQGFALVITGAVGASTIATDADLAVSIEPRDQVAPVGDLGTIRVTVTNLGNTSSRGGMLRIEMDDGLETLNRRPALGSCESTPTSIECELSDLEVGDTETVIRSLRVTQPGIHTVHASVRLEQADADGDNNDASAIIRTPNDFDLELFEIDGPSSLNQNAEAEYSAVVRNNGPDKSTATTMQIMLDDGLRVLSSMDCAVSSETSLSCEVPALEVDTTHRVNFRLAAIVATGTPLEIRSALGQPSVDNDETNNAISLSVAVAALDDPENDDPDSDGDGVPDALDMCADADDLIDADGDGTPDGCDACPDDANKIDAGLCGCGNPETDSDSDGIPDCGDGCPQDPNKLDPGDCGCGIADVDADASGVSDCLENETPAEPPVDDNGPPQFEIRLEDLDPCLVRYLMQSFLGIPMCGPCISFGCCGTILGIATLRRGRQRWRARR